MSILIRYAILFVVLLGLLSSMGNGRADRPVDLQSEPTTADAVAAKARALQWVDDYRENQVLFHDEDVASLREQLADGSPEEALRWWSNTARIRAALASPEWRDTHEWFRDFLKVQAIFSDDEIDALRSRAWTAAQQESSRALREILAEVETYRTNLVQAATDDRAIRKYQLSALASLRRDQASQRGGVARAAEFVTNRQPVRPRPSKYAPIRRWGGWRIFLRL